VFTSVVETRGASLDARARCLVMMTDDLISMATSFIHSLRWKSEPWNLERWHHHLKCHRTQTQKPLSWKLQHTDELLMVIRASRTWALYQYSV